MWTTLHSTWRRAVLALGALGLVLSASVGTASAAFPGANGKLAFISNRDGNNEIYVMNALGGGQTRLTNNAAGEFAPAWSPDGSKIAFASFRDGNWEVYVMNADGTGRRNLTRNATLDFLYGTAVWSPDGRKIVFERDRNGDGGSDDIYVTTPTGPGSGD